jgi:inosose dehydratase
MTMNFGCQTYTWQMTYDKYAGRMDYIVPIVAQAGFRGIEAEVCMLGRYYEDPGQFADLLDRHSLQLSALTLALPWQEAKETAEELAEAEKLFAYLKHFPDTLLALVPLPGKDRSNIAERQRHSIQCVNAVAQRAKELGIASALHPNSPPGSVFRTEEDYKVMFDLMDTRYVGYAPDSGHIANGGMDPLQVFKNNLPIIKHVHFKDISADKAWKAMGEGIIDHPAIMSVLKDGGYNGWIMVEEESDEGEKHPDSAAMHNGAYMNGNWQQLYAKESN